MTSTFVDKSGRGILLTALNQAAAQQGYTFVKSDLDFGPVEASTNPAREAQIQYAATEASRFIGSQTAFYNRLDLTSLFANAGIDTVQIHKGPLTTEGVVAKLNQRYGLGFTAEDIVFGEAIAEDATEVVLTAEAGSHGYVGTVVVELVEGKVPLAEVVLDPVLDGPVYPGAVPAYLIDPVIIEGTVTPKGQKENGTLLTGSGNRAEHMVIASNGEIELALAARIYRTGDLIIPEDGHYSVEIADDGDWTWPFSVAMLEEDRPATDLYDITLTATSIESQQSVEFKASRDVEGVYHFANEEFGLDIIDSDQTPSGSVVQNIQRMTFYKDFLGQMTENAGGAPIGEFIVSLQAVRRDGLAEVVKVEITVDATVTAA